MKKIIALLLLLSLCLSLAVSCKKDGDDEEKPDVNDTDTGVSGGGTGNNNGTQSNLIDTSGLEGVDLLEGDLSEYVEIDEKYYKGYDVLVDPERVSEFVINNQIINVLCQYKGKEKIEGDGVISVGDVANIYYRGYYIDEEGGKVYFDGGCNFNSSRSHALEIGSHGFIPGFEYNLIGKNKENYATLEKLGEGAVSAGDIIYITYSFAGADGTTLSSKSALVDLSASATDEVWGEGFVDYFKNNTVSVDQVIDSITVSSVTTEGMTDVYTDVRVVEIYRVGSSDSLPVLEVESYFPEGYKAEELAGKTAFFEVYVTSLEEYDAPTLDETFITETIKMSADDLAGYEGEGIVEKYRSYLREEYMLENGLDENSLIQNAFWESILSGVVIKKYPEKQVAEIYNSYVQELEYYYQSYSYYYKYDDFMCLYIGLEVGSDWKSELKEKAREQVKQQLVFYHIMNKEGLKPSPEEYEALFDEYLTDALAQSSITPDKYASEAEYLAEKERYKQQIIQQAGEEYFKSMIYYEVAIEALMGYANIIETVE